MLRLSTISKRPVTIVNELLIKIHVKIKIRNMNTVIR